MNIANKLNDVIPQYKKYFDQVIYIIHHFNYFEIYDFNYIIGKRHLEFWKSI